MAQRRIVDHLKRSGPCTTADLAAALDITTQAVRPQLAELEAAGLVNSETITTGVRGRPPVGWALSAKAVDLFPDRHGDLTVELINAIRATIGEDALDAVLAERDRRQFESITKDLRDEASVAERAATLVRYRVDQGYMAELITDGDDLLLVEHHCPICAAATECQGLCKNELDLFRRILGPNSEVERTAHLLSGDERCIYRIRSGAAGN